MSDYSAWIVIYPAPDVPGQWIAHCLELDVVTQGNSLPHALHMADEAMTLMLEEDERISQPRRRAPEECWEPLWSLFNEGIIVTPRYLERIDAQFTMVGAYFRWSPPEGNHPTFMLGKR